MTIQFLGAAGEVTGSCYYLQGEGVRFLVDCGMFQGGGESDEKNHAPWPFDPSSLDFVLLTHAHFDHCGRLPKLYHDGFRGKIYTTIQTSELANLILADAADLMFHQAREHGAKPLYTLNEVKALNVLYHPVKYDQMIELPSGIQAIFHDAGHVLGSAIIEIKIAGKVIVFSGDLGNDPAPFMNTPETLSAADVVVMESTYGDRLHEHTDRRGALKQTVLDVVSQHGTLLIPAFALERTQEIIYYLNDLRETKEIPDIPIYLDSPLAIEITAVFRRNENVFDDEAKKHLEHGDDIFTFPHLKYCSTVEESKSLEYVPSPKVIIAGSGMMNGGRILHHLLRYGPYKNTIICMVGFQVPGTLGRRLLDGEKHVQVMRNEITINAEIREISAFSSHADQHQLLDWVNHFQKLSKLFIIHGEETSGNTLASIIAEHHKNWPVIYPELMQTEEL